MHERQHRSSWGISMTDLSTAIEQMAILFLVACIGFASAKLGFIDNHAKDKFNKLLMNVTLPCMIVASAEGASPDAAGALIGGAFVLGAVLFFMLLLIGFLCNLLLRVPHGQRRLYLFMSVCSNMGFLGIPLIASVFGDASIILSSIFVMMQGVFLYSIGLMLLASKESGGASMSWTSIVNPAMVACILAVALFLGGVQLPSVIQGTLDMVGGLTTPIALMLIGVIISQVNVKAVVSEWRMYPYVAIKQLIVPAALFLVLRSFLDMPLLVGVFVLMMAMPVGTLVPMWAEQFGRDPVLGAKGTIISTALSFAFLPVLITFMVMA